MNTENKGTKLATKKPIVIERTYQAALETVWDLWTTKAGIESWWGPEGFTVEVLALELRPGGALHYTMTATAPEQVAFMTQAGLPLTNEARATFTAVAPPQRLAYDSVIDFVPGVAPFTIANLVELSAGAQGVRVVLTFDALHDEEWTERLVKGRESQLDKLAKVLEQRGPRA
jgi:uncharacterized protein YndB with AHSA1/START domain